MEKKMKATIKCRGSIRGYVGVIWGYMEKKMEVTIMGFIGTTMIILSFNPSHPKASNRTFRHSARLALGTGAGVKASGRPCNEMMNVLALESSLSSWVILG